MDPGGQLDGVQGLGVAAWLGGDVGQQGRLGDRRMMRGVEEGGGWRSEGGDEGEGEWGEVREEGELPPGS